MAGIGNGINTTVVPVWQAEACRPSHRGRMMVLQLVLNQLGNVTAQSLNFGLGFIDDRSISWQFPIAFQIYYALTTISLVPWLPDSPRWLIQKDRSSEARGVIARIHSKQSDDPDIVTLYEAVVQSVHDEMEVSRSKWSTLLRSNRLQTTRRVLLGAASQLMQQW